ncbi:MAG: DUF4340 domain-containing protein [Vicinamibacteria bacterium]|nr:DUF4340 domain-containing protein [Vicinamibacteria bacterium]
MKVFWKTYVAFVVLVGLGAYIYFVERKRPASDEKPKEKVFAVQPDKVKELAIAPSQGESIRLERKDDGWRMVAPRDVATATSEVDSLLSSIETMEIDEVVLETADNLTDYGLDKPKVAIEVLVEGASEPAKLLIGKKTPGESALYAKRPTEARIFTIASHLENAFNKKPFDLRDRDLLHVKRDEIKTLAIDGPEGRYALKRQGEDTWIFTAPLKTRAGRWSVDSLLGSLEYLRLDSIAAEKAENLASFGIDRPKRTITIGLAEDASKTLQIGNETADNKFYAREASAALVGVIPRTLIEDLEKGMSELRAKRLLDVSAYDVEGFDLESDGQKSVYARSADKDKDGIDSHKWKRSKPDEKNIETSAVQDVLFKIGGVDVQEFIDAPEPLAAYGLDKPAIKVTLRHVAPKPSVWFELGKKGDDFYGRRPDDSAILKLDKTKAQELIDGFKGL